MSFLSRLKNLAEGKLSELTNKDESLSEARLKEELDKIQTPISQEARDQLTLRKQAPQEAKAPREPGEPKEWKDKGGTDEPDTAPPVKKTL